MVRIIAGLVIGNKIYMDRKKFFKSISVSIIGLAFLIMNPIKFFSTKNHSIKGEKIKVKINPLAVKREKIGKKNG
jgi:hypothetical protein